MSRFLMKISFDGTAYHGWQVQDNAVTVQQTVQDALENVFGFRPNVTGCSRTDSGVHALCFCFHFDVDTLILEQSIVKAVNANLPDDIVALCCKKVDKNFHSRYNAKYKEYEYKFFSSKIRSPFSYKYSLLVDYDLDVELLNSAAKQFIGKYDFSAFCSSGSSVKDKTRNVIDAQVVRKDNYVIFRVKADGFLYNMVRIMAGTLLYVAMGKISANEIKDIILSGERSRAGITAPPQGLYLKSVEY